jgi:hypothetical protein
MSLRIDKIVTPRPAQAAGELISRLAGPLARGLVAGAAGTAAMTISSAAEAKVRKRSASSAPADAAGQVLGAEPSDEQAKERFSNAVHWGYGTSWGAVRGPARRGRAPRLGRERGPRGAGMEHSRGDAARPRRRSTRLEVRRQ